MDDLLFVAEVVILAGFVVARFVFKVDVSKLGAVFNALLLAFVLVACCYAIIAGNILAAGTALLMLVLVLFSKKIT